MKIKLRKDWDNPIHITKPSEGLKLEGRFWGRHKEVQTLTSSILNRTQGSLLVCGHRGVGKTSFVYKAISEAQKVNEQIVPVLLNLAQLEDDINFSSKNDKISSEKIIQNLIRRLYSALENNLTLKEDVKNKLDILYKKALASDFKLKESLINRLNFTSSVANNTVYSIKLKNLSFTKIIYFTSFILALILELFLGKNPNIFVRFIPVISALPFPFLINYIKEITKQKKTELALKYSAEELYEYDNSITNLEFDLEQIHHDLSEAGIKIVYILDELDKLSQKTLLNVLRYFKNLFTLSKAIFVFIGGEELYDLKNSQNNNDLSYRDESYTYFSAKFFITRPLCSDLNDFLGDIFEVEEIDNALLDKFKLSLIFDAKNDYFDLISVIRDRITNYENQIPIINLYDLSFDDEQKAKFNKTITLVYETKHRYESVSKWKTNELIIRQLYNHAYKIYNSSIGQEILDESEETPQASALRNFNSVLLRFGILSISKENQKKISGIDIPIRTYIYSGGFHNDPPESINVLTDTENKYINNLKNSASFIYGLYIITAIARIENISSFGDFLNYIINFVADLHKRNIDFQIDFNFHFSNYKGICENLFVLPREKIETFIKELVLKNDELLKTYYTYIALIISQAFPAYTFSRSNIIQNDYLFNNIIKDKRMLLKDGTTILHTPNLSKEIMITNNLFQKFSDYVPNSMKVDSQMIINIEKKSTSLDQTSGIITIDLNNKNTFENEMKDLASRLSQFLS